jgi:hypothetical protein
MLPALLEQKVGRVSVRPSCDPFFYNSFDLNSQRETSVVDANHSGPDPKEFVEK